MEKVSKDGKRKAGMAVAVALCLALVAVPVGAQIEEGLQVHGFLENFSILRSDTFKEDYHVATSRYRGSLQISGPLKFGPLSFESLLGLPIIKAEFFMELRPEYESVYDIDDRFGTGREPDSIAVSGRSAPVRPAGNTAGLYSLLTAFGYNPHDFGAIWTNSNIIVGHRLSPSVPFIRKESEDAYFSLKESQNDLRFGMTRATNSDLYYPMREAYVDIWFELFGRNWLRAGKQQIVWGKADFFRLQDLVNPVDFSQHFFIDAFDDIRVPQWSLLLEHRFGTVGPLRELAGGIVWVFDRYTPLGFGHPAQPWAIGFGRELDAFTFASDLFGEVLFPGENVEASLAENHNPAWNLKNSGIGTRWEWTIGNFRFQVTDWFAFQDVPSFGWDRMHILEIPGCMEALPPAGSGKVGKYGPEGGKSVLSPVVEGGLPVRINVKPKEIRVRQAPIIQDVINSPYVNDIFINRCGFTGVFAARYRKVNTLGLSMDWFEPVTGFVFRTEASWTNNLLTTDTNRIDWFADTNVFRWVLGVDRQTMIRPLNRYRSFFLSAQAFGTHFPDHRAGRRGGAQGAQNNFIFTAFAIAPYYRDQLLVAVFGAYGTTGQDGTTGGNIEWLIDDHWSVQLGVTAFLGSRQEHSDGPFAGFNTDGRPFTENALGIAHMQAGGAERNQMDEFWGRLRYRF